MATSNKIRALNRLPFDFQDGLKIGGVDVTQLKELGTSAGASKIGYMPAGTGAVATTVQAKLREFVSVKDFGAVGDGVTDDTGAIQKALDAALYVDFVSSSSKYKVSGTLNLRSGHNLNFRGAQVTQTKVNTNLFYGTTVGNITVCNGVFVGVGSDYIDGSGPNRVAFYFNLSSDVTIRNCVFKFFSSSAAAFVNTSRVRVFGNFVEGPGSPPITPVTSGYNSGFTADNGCSDVVFEGNHIRKTAQGIATGSGVRDCVIVGNVISDIVGQHGIYCGAGHVNLTISGNTISTTAVQGIKVQNSDSYANHAKNIVISNNCISSTGSHGIIVINATGLTYKIQGISIVGNTIDTCGEDGVLAGSLDGGTISDNTITNAVRNGIRLSDSANVVISANMIKSAARNGIKGQGASSFVTISNNRIINCCSDNFTAEEQGIYITDSGTEYDIRANVITDAASNMRYGLFIAAANQTSHSVVNNIVTGASDFGARFAGTGINLRLLSGNLFSGALGDTLNAPATDQRGNTGRIFYGTAAPTAGTWQRGDILWNTTPSAGGLIGWVCTAAGTPGTWIPLGYGVLSGSATYDPPSLADGVGSTTTVTVTGAALGDFAEASFSLDLQGITLTAWVSATNTVSVRFQNETGGVLDLGSGTLRARVRKA